MDRVFKSRVSELRKWPYTQVEQGHIFDDFQSGSLKNRQKSQTFGKKRQQALFNFLFNPFLALTSGRRNPISETRLVCKLKKKTWCKTNKVD